MSYLSTPDNSSEVNVYRAEMDGHVDFLFEESGSFGEGQTLTVSGMQDSSGRDLKGMKNIPVIGVMFYFESPSATDQTEPTVSIKIGNGSEGGELYTDTQTSFEHSWEYFYIINNLTELDNTGNITMSADSQEDFLFQLEVGGEYIFVDITYENSNALVPEDDSLDYEIVIFVETWNIQNINVVEEV